MLASKFLAKAQISGNTKTKLLSYRTIDHAVLHYINKDFTERVHTFLGSVSLFINLVISVPNLFS